MITLGEDASPEQIRSFLRKIDVKRECKNEKGQYISPINGMIFDSWQALAGHFGAFLTPRKKDPSLADQPTRSGYIYRIQNDMTPTEEQRIANTEYIREWRIRQRAKAEEREKKGVDSATDL